jgi:hypothetical protein
MALVMIEHPGRAFKKVLQVRCDSAMPCATVLLEFDSIVSYTYDACCLRDMPLLSLFLPFVYIFVKFVTCSAPLRTFADL